MKKLVISSLLAVVLLLSTALCGFAADDFAPSVTSKPAPEIVSATITDGSGTTDVDLSLIDITPLADADAASAAIKTRLLEAYDDILKAESLNALVNTDLGLENPGVRDLFDLAVDSATLATLNSAAENHLSIVFKLGLAADAALPTVIYKCDAEDDVWKVVDAANVIRLDDGDVEVIFHELCTIGFIYPNVNGQGGDNPQTGMDSAILTGVMSAIAVAVIATGSFMIFRKKKTV